MRKPQYHLRLRRQRGSILLAIVLALLILLVLSSFFLFLLRCFSKPPPDYDEFLVVGPHHHTTIFPPFPSNSSSNTNYSPVDVEVAADVEDVVVGPYHDWDLFARDFANMMRKLKIFVYPANSNSSNSNSSTNDDAFAGVFLPHPNPLDPKLGNYYSEHMFKVSLLRSSLLTTHPHEAHFYFLPFSINALRNHPLVHSESAISQFVSQYTTHISHRFGFWNASGGADHFFVCCHSVGREAASLHPDLRNNAIQVTCSSSYFHRFYITHKDFGFPQIWPRPPQPAVLNPPHKRDKLVFYAGRMQNSIIRQQLIALWGNDTSLHIFSTTTPPSFPYQEGFRKSKFCLHLKGYEVNTARVSDAIHYGCIPVIISNYYDLPFANVLDWSKFSVIISHADISRLKPILLSIPTHTYLTMYTHLCLVRKHFVWHTTPRGYDAFHMTAYQLWLRRRSSHHHVSSSHTHTT